MQGKQAWLAVAVAVLAVAAGNGFSAPDTASATQATAKAARREAARRREARQLLRKIGARQHETWHWERVMGARPTLSSDAGVRIIGLGYRRWVLRLWSMRARHARRRAQHPPHLRAWLCIHRY